MADDSDMAQTSLETPTAIADGILNAEEIIMWFMDLPMDKLDESAIYQVVANSVSVASQEEQIHRFGRCITINDFVDISPVSSATDIYWEYVSQSFSFRSNTGAPRNDVVLNLISGPSHGKLDLIKNPIDKYSYRYTPEPDFYGADTFVFEVKADGVVVWIYYLMSIEPSLLTYILDENGESVPDLTRCPKEHWKFSQFSIQSLNLAFSDLPGSSLAQTTGTGASAQITLDTDAAGYGWFIDYTPYLNEEYLPTSTPYEWIAQPGSAAEGKIDLLSVLWHELGHAYGLDHTADSHDLMATTLQPGVRRLPSAEELALLSPMLADAGWLAYASTLSDSSGQIPDTPNAPLPMSVGLAAFLASRQRRTTETPKTSTDGITRYEVVANPEFTNASPHRSG